MKYIYVCICLIEDGVLSLYILFVIVICNDFEKYQEYSSNLSMAEAIQHRSNTLFPIQIALRTEKDNDL